MAITSKHDVQTDFFRIKESQDFVVRQVLSYSRYQIACMNETQGQHKDLRNALRKYTTDPQWINVDEHLKAGGAIQPGTLLLARRTSQVLGVFLFHDESTLHFISINPDLQGEVYQIQRYKLLIDLSHQLCVN